MVGYIERLKSLSKHKILSPLKNHLNSKMDQTFELELTSTKRTTETNNHQLTQNSPILHQY